MYPVKCTVIASGFADSQPCHICSLMYSKSRQSTNPLLPAPLTMLFIPNPNSLSAASAPCFHTPTTASKEAARKTGEVGRARCKSPLGTGTNVEAVNQGWESGLSTYKGHQCLTKSRITALRSWRMVRLCVCFGKRTVRGSGRILYVAMPVDGRAGTPVLRITENHI